VWWVETPNQPHDPDTPRVALIVPENRRNYNVDSDILAEVVLKIRRAVTSYPPADEEYSTISSDENWGLHRRLGVIEHPIECFSVHTIRGS